MNYTILRPDGCSQKSYLPPIKFPSFSLNTYQCKWKKMRLMRSFWLKHQSLSFLVSNILYFFLLSLYTGRQKWNQIVNDHTLTAPHQSHRRVPIIPRMQLVLDHLHPVKKKKNFYCAFVWVHCPWQGHPHWMRYKHRRGRGHCWKMCVAFFFSFLHVRNHLCR